MTRTLIAGLAVYLVVVAVCLTVGSKTGILEDGAGIDTEAPPPETTLKQVLGRHVRTDFLADFASARALRAGTDPYLPMSELISRAGGPPWRLKGANPHPPTLLGIVLPLTFLGYGAALCVWSVGMILLLVGTLRLGRLRWGYAVPAGVFLGCVWPGAMAVGNPVPLTAFGIALAYRFRASHWLAGTGIALAAAPKLSGAVIALAFLVASQWRAIAVAAGGLAIAAVTPFVLFGGVWSSYLDAGGQAIRFNARRPDNAAIFNVGLPPGMTVLLLVVSAVAVAVRRRDAFWPAAWLTVALLPIAWMYSLIALVPMALHAATGRRRLAVGCVAAAALLTFSSPPLGEWSTRVFPLIVALVLAALLFSDAPGFWRAREVGLSAGDGGHGSARDQAVC